MIYQQPNEPLDAQEGDIWIQMPENPKGSCILCGENTPSPTIQTIQRLGLDYHPECFGRMVRKSIRIEYAIMYRDE